MTLSVYLPTVATAVLSHSAEGQISQNASQRDMRVTPVDPAELFLLTGSSGVQTLSDEPLWRSGIHLLSDSLSHCEAEHLKRIYVDAYVHHRMKYNSF